MSNDSNESLRRVYKMLYGSELVADKMSLQSKIWDGVEPLETVLDDVMAAVIYARKPEFTHDPQRICITEDLLLVYYQMDPQAHATTISETSHALLSDLPTTSQCRFCMATLHAQGLASAGQLGRAEETIHTHLALLPNTGAGWEITRRLDLICILAEIAHTRGDTETLRQHLENLRNSIPLALEHDALNPPLNAWIHECEIRSADAEGRVDDVLPNLSIILNAVAPGQESALRGSRLAARALLRAERWQDAKTTAETALKAAHDRQAHRYYAELLICAVEATRALGQHDEADQHTETLKAFLPRLKSRDLDTFVAEHSKD